MKNEIKRHFFNQIDYVVDKEQQRVILRPHFLQKLQTKKLWNKFGFKKVGGSRIGDVLELSNFSSPFSAFCNITWIGLPILDRKYVDAGIVIEPKVIDFLKQKWPQFQIETFDPIEYNYDYFKDKDPIVGGIPDGYIQEKKIIIEIKTTKIQNWEFWNQGNVPTAYIRQAQLYAYLMGVNHFSIIATFLQEQDYQNPQDYDLNQRKIKNWNFNVNLSVVKDDIQKIKQWYQKNIIAGISPQYDVTLDQDLLSWLECRDQQEWETLKQAWIKIGKLVI